jgi:UDP-2-acetamido-3-amino-2,3-dideoxy-glucuronate N-acetyltransferase
MSDKFNVAVVGCGHWGKNHVRTFHQLGALTAISDPHPETGLRLSKQYDVALKSFEGILNDQDIDGVVIAAPAEMHAKLALAALSAGKHVLVEKPIAISMSDARSMVDAATEYSKTLMVGHILRYHPAYEKLAALASEGVLGKLRYIHSHRLSMGKLRTEENALWSFAPHDISMILGLTGESPEEIVCHDASFITDGVEDVALVHMKFSAGVSGHIFASWLNPFKEQKLTVVGDKAMAVFDDCAPLAEKLALYRHKIEDQNGAPTAIKAEPEFITIDDENPLSRECRHFIECASTGAKPLTDGEEALRVLDVLQRASPQ